MSIYEPIAEALATHGWTVTREFIAAELVRELAEEASVLLDAGALRPAQVGRGQGAHLAPSVRGDRIHWLDAPGSTRSQRACLGGLEMLRQTLNCELQLGLFEFEGHFAAYPPGGFYRKHRDQHTGSMERVVSCVLYLNDDWRGEDGGQLRLYLDESPEENFHDVLPQGGTLVCFLSDRFWHEVLPATRARLSLTGWFRRRASP
jgi:SM-20-related protein